MPSFSQRCPDDLHAALRAWLNSRPWLSQNDLVNGAIATMIGFPAYRVDAAPPTLKDYLRSGAIDDVAYRSLSGAIARGQCIAIGGPPGSGKSSLLRALVEEYQSLPNQRRALVVTLSGGIVAKTTPLLVMRLDDPKMRAKELAVPDFIEAVFADDVPEVVMRGVVPTWEKTGGAFTYSDSDIPDSLLRAVAVHVQMKAGRIVMLIDSLPHENTPEKMDERTAASQAGLEVDALFDEIVSHYDAMGQIVRKGPNSGRVRDSMTRRVSIKTASLIGTLEIASVLLTASTTERQISWVTNIDGGGPSIVSDVTDFESAIALIG